MRPHSWMDAEKMKDYNKKLEEEQSKFTISDNINYSDWKCSGFVLN